MAEKCTEYGDNPTNYPVPTIESGPEIGRNLCRVKRRYEGKYGGYRIDIITDNLNERDKVGFICTICESIMKEACTSSSGEQFCSCCRNISSGKETSNVTVRKMINTLKCSCPLIERGCKWLGTLEDCEDHLDTCGYAYVSCKLTCGVVLRRNELEKHEKETCSQRVVKCDHCKKAYRSYKLNEHLNKCPKMKVPCDLCDTHTTREDMPPHLKHDCSMVQETCQLGCGMILTRNELIIHVKDTCVQRTIACEHCNISLKFCDYSKHLRECPNVKVSCELCDIGTMYRKDMTEHLKHDCGMVQETCQLGCGVILTRNELIIHVKDTCVQRTIACEHCDISVKFCDNSRHLEECPKVKMTCKLCSEKKYRKDMTEHLKDYCPEKILECPFVKYKCMTRITRKDMDNHLEEKETKHLGLKLSVMEDMITKQNEEITKQSEEITRQNEKITKQNENITKQSEEITKQSEKISKQNEDITQQNENITKQSEEITRQSEKIIKQNENITKQSEEITKQSEKISKQNEDITKQSDKIKKLKDENEKQNREIESEKRHIHPLYSISDITTLSWEIGNVTGLMWSGNGNSMSKQYKVAGSSCSLKLYYNRELRIVFPETTIKYDNPFIAKCRIALDSNNIINCGRIEVKQKDLTRGCEKTLTTISQENVDAYSKPVYPGGTQRNLTLWIYLAMQ